MTRTGVCVPLEEHTGLEPARSAWKAEMLPITSMLHITAPGRERQYHAINAATQKTCTVISGSRVEHLEAQAGIEPSSGPR